MEGKMNGEDNISSSFIANGVLEHTLKCLITQKNSQLARTQPISQFTLSEMGTQHTKSRNGKRQSLLAKLRHGKGWKYM